jgi:SAM-dependent methyltransferase
MMDRRHSQGYSDAGFTDEAEGSPAASQFSQAMEGSSMSDTRGTVDYGNWVPWKLVYIPAILAIVFMGFSLWWRPLLLGAFLCILASGYLIYARRQFSPEGGNLQARLRDLVFAHLAWNGDGKLLDIGCGNGALAVEAARRYPHAQVTGIDCWGGKWEYSIERCQSNALNASVAERTRFQKASAARLPFPDETFDVVVSNMVFHEVQEARDKRTVIREALRVLKKGGVFSFQDLFVWKSLYGEPQDLVAAVRSWGIDEVNLIDTSRQSFVPRSMRLPFTVGDTGLLCGTK